MKHLRRFDESIESSIVEIPQGDAYEYAKNIIDFPKTQKSSSETVFYKCSLDGLIELIENIN